MALKGWSIIDGICKHEGCTPGRAYRHHVQCSAMAHPTSLLISLESRVSLCSPQRHPSQSIHGPGATAPTHINYIARSGGQKALELIHTWSFTSININAGSKDQDGPVTLGLRPAIWAHPVSSVHRLQCSSAPRPQSPASATRRRGNPSVGGFLLGIICCDEWEFESLEIKIKKFRKSGKLETWKLEELRSRDYLALLQLGSSSAHRETRTPDAGSP
jgi:hypothetical protein